MNSREATIHLALLGMYADNALTEAEDALIDKLMTRLGWEEDTGVRSAFVSEAFDAVRALGGNEEAILDFLTKEIKPALATADEKEMALAELEMVVKADGRVASSEKNLLSLAGWVLK